jgi:hypothetical protein
MSATNFNQGPDDLNNPLRHWLENECKRNTRVKYFPDCIKIACFSKSIFNPEGFEEITKKDEKDEKVPKPKIKNSETRADSMKRSQDKVYEIAAANTFDYFVTLTLDEIKISRTDKDEIYKKLRNFLQNKVQRNGLKYLIVPEYHKDGEAIHFHGLLSGNLELKDSGKRYHDGRVIYNLGDWGYGFSTVLETDKNVNALAKYIVKYITKDSSRILGKYYLAGGKGLQRSVPTDYIDQYYAEFDGKKYQIPNAGMGVKYKTIFL